MFNEMSAGSDSSYGEIVFFLGGLVMGGTLFFWFSEVIKENHSNLYSDQLNRSFVWGMSWFIFSEVMFFAAFSGRYSTSGFVVDWIGGVGERALRHVMARL